MKTGFQHTLSFGMTVLCLGFALVTGSVNSAWAQKPGAGKAGGRDEILTTKDGWKLHATYFPSSDGKESPVVIMLPATDGPDAKDARTRKVWEKTALELQSNGFAALSLDLRKHGDSTSGPSAGTKPTAVPGTLRLAPNDYVLMATEDLEVAKEFLMKEHESQRLNIARTGILSAGSSSMVSVAFSAADWIKPPFQDAPIPSAGQEDKRTPRGQDVRALMMLTPHFTVKGLNSLAALKSVDNLPIAVHVLVAAEDKDGVRDGERVFKAVKKKGDEYKDVRLMTQAPVSAKAEGFLEGKAAEPCNKLILEFMTKNLKGPSIPWKSRKSRL
jgi:hypothetical protein